MAMKQRVLYLMQFLEKNSDEQHPVTTAELRRELAAKGCPVSIITLRADVESLLEAGYDILINEKEGFSTTYSWVERDLSSPELQILVDAVSSSQFITTEKSKELIRKLVSLAGPSYRKELTPQILVSEHVKAPNKQILLSVQAIRRAIDRDRKITFKYMQYNIDKVQVPRHAGTPDEDYIVSPYATIWNNDRYYLVGYSDKRNMVNTFRIDRMMNVKQIQRMRVPEPKDFNIQDYTDKVFWMYDGTEEQVTLRCKRHLVDQVIDKFGAGVNVNNIQRETFDITVPVHISGTFYAWINQYAGEMTIVKPDRVRQAFIGYLKELTEAAMDVLLINEEGRQEAEWEA